MVVVDEASIGEGREREREREVGLKVEALIEWWRQRGRKQRL